MPNDAFAHEPSADPARGGVATGRPVSAEDAAGRLGAARTPLNLQAAKLLRSKWTAAVPVNKEKHFIVTALIAPDAPGTQIDAITMEAVLTGRSFTLRWRELNDAVQWLQGWR